MNTTVIIIMIICATIIALVAIICDHLLEKKSSEVSECFLSKKIIKVHRNYIAGFLGFAIIMLLTANMEALKMPYLNIYRLVLQLHPWFFLFLPFLLLYNLAQICISSLQELTMQLIPSIKFQFKLKRRSMECPNRSSN